LALSKKKNAYNYGTKTTPAFKKTPTIMGQKTTPTIMGQILFPLFQLRTECAITAAHLLDKFFSRCFSYALSVQ
jgi:hypothetical protein